MLVNMPEVPEVEPFNIIIELLAFRRLLTIDELAGLLEKSKSGVYGMAQTHDAPGIMIGGTWRFDPSTVADWLIKKQPQLAVSARKLRKAA